MTGSRRRRTRTREGTRRTRLVSALVVLGLVAIPLAARAADGTQDGGQDGSVVTLTSACSAGLVLTAPAAGARAVLGRPAQAGPAQQWKVTGADTGFSTIASGGDGRVLDVEGARTAAGTPVIAYRAHGGVNQQWKVTDAGGGVVTVAARGAAGTVLTLSRTGAVRLGRAGTSCTTRWRVTVVEPAAPAEPGGTHGTHDPTATATGGAPAPQTSSAPPTVQGTTVSAGGTLQNRQPGSGLASTLTIPEGHPGYAEQRVKPITGALARAGLDIGAFRVSCEYSHMGFDDPVVKPGQPGASHLHTFFGNTGTTAASTPESIATTGRSTCHGGTANRSAYWVPTLYDTRTGQPLKPSFAIMYYKTGYQGVRPDEVVPAPDRLRIVAGNAGASSRQDFMSWGCLTSGGAVREPGSIPTDCAPGTEAVQMSVAFPQCWNGKDLDAPDHASHMAHAVPPTGCPASHPVALPQITINVRYTVQTQGDTRFWRLSSDMYSADKPGGLSAHGDWMNGWDPAIQKAWVDHCNHKAMDCSYQLGDGRELF